MTDRYFIREGDNNIHKVPKHGKTTFRDKSGGVHNHVNAFSRDDILSEPNIFVECSEEGEPLSKEQKIYKNSVNKLYYTRGPDAFARYGGMDDMPHTSCYKNETLETNPVFTLVDSNGNCLSDEVLGATSGDCTTGIKKVEDTCSEEPPAIPEPSLSDELDDIQNIINIYMKHLRSTIKRIHGFVVAVLRESK